MLQLSPSVVGYGNQSSRFRKVLFPLPSVMNKTGSGFSKFRRAEVPNKYNKQTRTRHTAHAVQRHTDTRIPTRMSMTAGNFVNGVTPLIYNVESGT